MNNTYTVFSERCGIDLGASVKYNTFVACFSCNSCLLSQVWLCYTLTQDLLSKCKEARNIDYQIVSPCFRVRTFLFETFWAGEVSKLASLKQISTQSSLVISPDTATRDILILQRPMQKEWIFRLSRISWVKCLFLSNTLMTKSGYIVSTDYTKNKKCTSLLSKYIKLEKKFFWEHVGAKLFCIRF